MSKPPFPMHARFQSTSTTRSPAKQRLSLRTSKCRSSVPSSLALLDASTNRGNACSSQARLQRPVARSGSGSEMTRSHPTTCSRLDSSVGRPSGGLAAWSASSAAWTASIRSADHGGGHSASERSSRTSNVASLSHAPRRSGMNGPRTASRTRRSARSQETASSVSACLTKAERPSASSTRQCALTRP